MKPIIKYLFIIFILTILSCSGEHRKLEKEHSEEKITALSPRKDDVVYEGDLIFLTQQDVDRFDSKYTFINGNVRITNSEDGYNTSIVNFNSFKNIREINGNLELRRLPNLETLKGFDQLQTVNGDFALTGKVKESNLFFKNLKKVNGDFYFADDSEIFSGFNSIEKLKGLYITGLNSKKINIFSNLKSVNKIYFTQSSVDSVKFLPELKQVAETITFEFSPKLVYVDLPKLESVGSYLGFTDTPNLKGNINIPNAKKINHFMYFLNNENWKDFCFLTKYLQQKKIDSVSLLGRNTEVYQDYLIKNCRK